jgi:DNA-directed RNA polymerase subunit RPC12/RpoP
MLCKRCEAQTGSSPTRPHAAERYQALRCDRCGAAILTLAGVVVGVGDHILAELARFGLATRGKPLLKPKRRGA